MLAIYSICMGNASPRCRARNSNPHPELQPATAMELFAHLLPTNRTSSASSTSPTFRQTTPIRHSHSELWYAALLPAVPEHSVLALLFVI